MKISLSFILLVLFSLYIGYFDNLLIFIFCLLLHECGHLLFIILFKVKINKFKLSISGGLLNLDLYTFNKLTKNKKILIYSMGVIINLFLYYIFKNSLFGKYNLLLFVFNSLPIYPLDGYNILKLLLNKTFINNLSIVSITFLFIVSIYTNSVGLFIISIILVYKNIIYFKEKEKNYLINLINNMI